MTNEQFRAMCIGFALNLLALLYLVLKVQ